MKTQEKVKLLNAEIEKQSKRFKRPLTESEKIAFESGFWRGIEFMADNIELFIPEE